MLYVHVVNTWRGDQSNAIPTSRYAPVTRPQQVALSLVSTWSTALLGYACRRVSIKKTSTILPDAVTILSPRALKVVLYRYSINLCEQKFVCLPNTKVTRISSRFFSMRLLQSVKKRVRRDCLVLNSFQLIFQNQFRFQSPIKLKQFPMKTFPFLTRTDVFQYLN